MPASSHKLPTPAANTGPAVRTWTRTIGAEAQIEHFNHAAHGETAAVTAVAASASSVTLAALNQPRTGLALWNDSDDSKLHITLGATATTALSSFPVAPGATWVLPLRYAGVISGIWTNPSGGAVSGFARVTEVSP